MEAHVMNDVLSPPFDDYVIIDLSEDAKVFQTETEQDECEGYPALEDGSNPIQMEHSDTAVEEKQTAKDALALSEDTSAKVRTNPVHFLGVEENRKEMVQVSEARPVVKIEIDVADTKFLADYREDRHSSSNIQNPPSSVNTGKDPDTNINIQEGSQTIINVEVEPPTRIGMPEDHQSHVQKSPAKVEPSTPSSTCTADDAHTEGRPAHRGVGMVPFTQSADADRNHGINDCRIKDKNVELVTDQGPHDFLNILIKQEPLTELMDKAGDTNMLASDTINGTGSSEVTGEHQDEKPAMETDFVIKMEPASDSDQDTVMDTFSDRAHGESSAYNSSTEDEDYHVMKQQVKLKTREKNQSRKEVPRPFQCEHCDSSFKTKTKLKEHVRSHTDERPYSCHLCNVSFRKAESLKIHVRIHTGELPFRCQHCDGAFKCSQQLKRHEVMKHSTFRPYPCSECDAKFFSQSDLRAHRRIHTGEKPYQCKDCHAAFKKSSALTCHMRIHTGQKPYPCSVCDRTFRRSDQLRRHMKLHTGEKPFTCNQCDAAFTGSSDLKRHCARKHSAVKPFPCPECGSRFYTNEDLKMHRSFHTGIKPHVCTECGAAFVKAGDLKVHIRIHTGERPYTCKLCSATFARSGDLRLHIRMHEDKRPFTCTVCSLSFRRSGHLSRHMKTHTGLKSYSCEYCDAAFFTKSDLKRHTTRVHRKGDAPFSCTQCEAKFFTNSELTFHMRRHTYEEPYLCSVCGAAFSQPDFLKSHCLEMHGDKEQQGDGRVEPLTGGEHFMYVDVSMVTPEEIASSQNHSE